MDLFPPPYSTNNEISTMIGLPQNFQTSTSTNTNVNETATALSRALQQQQPNTTINLTNSSDVVIGPMTQFNGRVTIYQYLDAKLTQQKRTGMEDEDEDSRKSERQNKKRRKSVLKNWLNILAICSIILGISSTIYFVIYTDHSGDVKQDIVFGRNYDSDTFPNLYGHYIIDRLKWGASNNSKFSLMTKLEHPTRHVVVGHMGVQTEPCFNIYQCSVKMRAIQDNSIGNKGLNDVSSNFYLGGDGNIYVGRGWDYENWYGDKSISLQFLGDFMRYELEERQWEAMEHLLNYGKLQGYLDRSYKIFGLNQTRFSKYSPGVNVMKRLKKLPRYSFCGEDGFESCGADVGLKWNIQHSPR